jgi:molecular chaperone HscC
VTSTGHTKTLVIEQNPGTMSPKEIASRLKALSDLKIHPRDQAENRAVLARAERLYEERLGDLRDYLGQLITRFESILARQDPREIADARQNIAGILDEIEGDAWF